MALYLVRRARISDIDDMARIEQQCFPIGVSATKEQIERRMKCFGNHFYVLEYAGITVGFINGMVTNEEVISDDMYENELLHNEQGRWQTVFGLDVAGEFRRRGFAAMLMNELIKDSRNDNRNGVILTCKEELIHYYERFGFRNQGISESVHGGVVWYDMRLVF